jgi:type 1 fimbriae regulatory protein FimE
MRRYCLRTAHDSDAARRHACGYKLSNEGKDTRSLQWYLGHKNIQHTVRYTELNAARFNDWFKD